MERSLQRQLTIRQLRLIAVLGQELNLSKCAEKLHTTQPAASRALAMLESMLGMRLFDRTTKHIAPTAAGLGLIQHANRILLEIDRAEDHLRSLGQGAKGEIRIGLLGTFSAQLLAHAVDNASRVLPGLSTSVQVKSLAGLHRDLLDGRIDIMLAHAELAVDVNLVEVEPLYEEYSCVVAAPSHGLVSRKRASWSDLANQRWVLPLPQTLLRLKLDRMIAVHRTEVDPAANVQTDSCMLALELVRGSGMLWAIAGHHAQAYEKAGLIRRVVLPGEILHGTMCCFRLRQGPSTGALSLFMTCLQEAAAGLS